MAESARARRHIRTPGSRERERAAKAIAVEFLKTRGLRVKRTGTVRRAMLVDVTGPTVWLPRTHWKRRCASLM